MMHCRAFADEYRGKTIDQIEELRGSLRLISTNHETWTKIFECSECGQPWEEAFEETGHGEIPVVRKLGSVAWRLAPQAITKDVVKTFRSGSYNAVTAGGANYALSCVQRPFSQAQLQHAWTVRMDPPLWSRLAWTEFARQDIRTVLQERFGIPAARRAIGTDSSEEVILLAAEVFARIDPTAVALAVMDVLPHVKVWVIEEHPAWDSEQLWGELLDSLRQARDQLVAQGSTSTCIVDDAVDLVTNT
jgi:hypothetical protein